MTQESKLRAFLKAILEMKTHIQGIPSGYHYHGTEDYLLDRGRAFESRPLTPREHQQVLEAVDNWGRRLPLKQCFYNSQMVLFHDESKTLRYAEGYACGPSGMPVLHAWLTIGRSHKVVDLTWRTGERRKGRLSDRILGTIPEDWCYFGVEIPRRKVIERALDTEMAQSHLEDWIQGFPLFKQVRVHPVKDLLR